VSIIVGVEMALSVVGFGIPFDVANSGLLGIQFSFLAFAWVALIPVPGRRPAGLGAEFTTRLLPPFAVLQALHAFPVAGSQVGWSTFLLIPVGAVCLSNGVRGVAACLPGQIERRAATAIGVSAALLVALHVGDVKLRDEWNYNRSLTDAWTPLGLPGSNRMRVSPEDRELYGAVTAALNENCRAFLTLPGMNSFYPWTGQEPPTGLNATAWMFLFDDAEQQRVISEVSSTDRLCVLRNRFLEASWGPPSAEEGPLISFMNGADFERVAMIGDYELLRRREPGAAA
jgi:hypothetical protein